MSKKISEPEGEDELVSERVSVLQCVQTHVNARSRHHPVDHDQSTWHTISCNTVRKATVRDVVRTSGYDRKEMGSSSNFLWACLTSDLMSNCSSVQLRILQRDFFF